MLEQSHQKELERLLGNIRREYLPDNVVVNPKFTHKDYDNENKGPAEIDDKQYINRVFDIKFYKPIEKQNECNKEIILRHELIHISDMVNPDFHYISNDKEWDCIKSKCGTPEWSKEAFIIGLVRQYLWEISIVMRLKEKLKLDDSVTIDERKNNFISRFGGSYKPGCDKKEMLESMVNPIKQLLEKNMLCWDAMRKVAIAKTA